MAEPAAALALLTLVFGLAFSAPPLGRDFALFYASGYLPFMFYSDLAQKIGVALRFSRPLLAYPAVSWFDALVARFVLAVLTHAVVIALMLGGLWAISPAPPQPDIPMLISGLLLAAGLGLSLGALNAFLFGMFPVWERLWAILNRPLFILSGVLFLPEAVPDPYGSWLRLNPLVHVIGITRAGIFGGYVPEGASALYVSGLSLAALALALIFLRRHARNILADG
ncbi:ABC transporter permease [Aquicoccus sp. G2-2]|uniref:ABC transporter permease n=1 Tax=Aquicoccus sp. G2-2 TaxID=3092120 RepID=UPI002ADF0093|nr:ABC transporter permease [Aquicoccus sp. G2-2]MEA1115079.1 ABC transporter permease [Aquicoccus sp. G2-2]